MHKRNRGTMGEGGHEGRGTHLPAFVTHVPVCVCVCGEGKGLSDEPRPPPTRVAAPWSPRPTGRPPPGPRPAAGLPRPPFLTARPDPPGRNKTHLEPSIRARQHARMRTCMHKVCVSTQRNPLHISTMTGSGDQAFTARAQTSVGSQRFMVFSIVFRFVVSK